MSVSKNWSEPIFMNFKKDSCDTEEHWQQQEKKNKQLIRMFIYMSIFTGNCKLRRASQLFKT